MVAAVTDEISQFLTKILFPVWLSVQLHEKAGSVSLTALSEPHRRAQTEAGEETDQSRVISSLFLPTLRRLILPVPSNKD